MAILTPPTPPTPPTTPDRSDRTNFPTRMYNFFVFLAGSFLTYVNDATGNVENNATEAQSSATAAAASEASASASATAAETTAGATAWVNGATYALNAAAVSQVNFQTYRKITASSVTTTDPASDSTNWTPLGTAAVSVAIHAATDKATPASGDEFGFTDSAASYGLKKLTWSELKAALFSAPTLTGNLAFSGTAQRITGDFTSGTIANRVFFQTSIANGTTKVGIIPNGTDTASFIEACNASDPTNAGICRLQMSSTAAFLLSSHNGTGTDLPLNFNVGASQVAQFGTGATVGIGSNAAATTRLIVKGSDQTSSNYALSAQDSAANNALLVRNDGQITTGALSKSPYNNTTASAANLYADAAGILYRSTSTLAVKTDVEEIDLEMAKRIVAALEAKTIWYRSLCEADNPDWSWWGLGAEDVAAIDPRLVHWGPQWKTVTKQIEKPVKLKRTVTVSQPLTEKKTQQVVEVIGGKPVLVMREVDVAVTEKIELRDEAGKVVLGEDGQPIYFDVPVMHDVDVEEEYDDVELVDVEERVPDESLPLVPVGVAYERISVLQLRVYGAQRADFEARLAALEAKA